MTALERTPGGELQLVVASRAEALPPWATRADLVSFFHHKMQPYHDSPDDVSRALDYAFSPEGGQGGFVVTAAREGRLVGALLMLNTGMGGYIPEHILLFVAVDPDLRGHGLGRAIIDRALAECQGDVKLHVEHDNPARRLYERLGFTSKYLEMRLKKG